VRKRDDRRRVLIAQKESMRWLRSLEVTQQLVGDQTRVVTVCDREGDIYELFAQARSTQSEFLIRAAQNRQTTSAEADDDRAALFAMVEASACQGQFRLKLQRTPRRAARIAVVSVRFTQLWLRPPEHLSELPPIAVTALLAEEMQPPVKDTPIRWLLRRDIGGARLGDGAAVPALVFISLGHRAEPITVPLYAGIGRAGHGRLQQCELDKDRIG
jgi:hypothetical protein